MIDYETVAAADGCVVKCAEFCCPLNEVQKDSFVVSAFCDQTISIHSEIPRCAESFCNDSPSKIDLGPVYFVQSEINAGRGFSVEKNQSELYRIARHISNHVYISINALKGFFVSKAKHFKRMIEKMKGKQYGYRGYSLCLLRL